MLRFLKQTRRKIIETSGDGAYGTRNYHGAIRVKRSLSEIAMYQAKQLFGEKLNLRNYNALVDETYAMIKALNKLTRLGMPETQRIKHNGASMSYL